MLYPDPQYLIKVVIALYLTTATQNILLYYIQLDDRQIIGAMVFLWLNPQNSWTKQQMFLFWSNLKS